MINGDVIVLVIQITSRMVQRIWSYADSHFNVFGWELEIREDLFVTFYHHQEKFVTLF